LDKATRQRLARLARQMSVDANLLASHLSSPHRGQLNVDVCNTLADRINEAHAEICDHLAMEEPSVQRCGGDI